MYPALQSIVSGAFYGTVKIWNVVSGQLTRIEEYLSASNALWKTDSNTTGAKAFSVVPRGATGQFSYSILPRK
jgi:hypothetical protein